MEDKFSQTEKSQKKNSDFFLKNIGEYSKNVHQLDTYNRIAAATSIELKGIENLLDIGNGGVFDYDTSQVVTITGLDLFLDQLPKDMKFPENVQMERGDALNVPKEDATYDGVVMVMLLHHLIGNTVSQCVSNVDRAIFEAHRVLKPGGKLVLVESCVPAWFFQFEKIVYPLAVPIINRLLVHPPAFQHTIDQVGEIVSRHFGSAPVVTHIPKGKYVLQLGVKVPSFLTPVQPYLLTVCKK